jgi:hypothetical protein
VKEIDIMNLQNTTGNQQVDNILRALISLYELLFPGRIRGYYLIGSYSDASAGSISDIDMYILFKNHFMDKAEENKAYSIQEACALMSPIRLDIPIMSEEQLKPEDVRLKLSSVLLYGEDIRDELALPTREAYSCYITQWPLHFFRRIHRMEVLHYLSIYRTYLLKQLQTHERDPLLFATKRLQEVIYSDQELMDTLRSIKHEHDDELRQAVIQALQRIENFQS